MNNMNSAHSKHHGFTLIEIAIVMSIIALLLGGMMIPLGTRYTEQRNAETQATLNKAVEAIIGFAILNRRLPCPDIAMGTAADRNGLEKSVGTPITNCQAGLNPASPNTPTLPLPTTGSPAVSWGDLPWATLGLSGSDAADAWNNRIRYAVYMPLVTQTAPAPLATVGLANVSAASQLAVSCINTLPVGLLSIPGCPTASPGTLSTNASFIVYSHGANGYGGTAIGNTTAMPFPTGYPATNDQYGNLPETEAPASLQNRFVYRPRTGVDSSLGEFDDLVTWVSSNTLAAKLLAAGVWP
jgi:prepilin-type N-terminal cleavage/methylation domain-containing protein